MIASKVEAIMGTQEGIRCIKAVKWDKEEENEKAAGTDLLSENKMRDLENLTFEKNGTHHLHEDFKRFLTNDYHLRKDQITFSVSPKLSASGELWKDAVCPEVVVEYQTRGFT